MAAEAPANSTTQPFARGLLPVGAALTHLGFVALATSAVWTTAPLSPMGLQERPMIALVGLALLVVAAIGRSRGAGSMAGKLLCALGAGMCLRLAVDPTVEKLPSLSQALPIWVLDAYPGLATVGWLLAAVGAVIWWVGGGRAGDVGPYLSVAACVGLILIAVALGTGSALRAAGYEVPAYDSGLLCWRIVEVVVTLIAAMSVSGRRGFGPWPMVVMGAGLLGHVGRTLISAGNG